MPGRSRMASALEAAGWVILYFALAFSWGRP